jgi:hypothetical protein
VLWHRRQVQTAYGSPLSLNIRCSFPHGMSCFQGAKFPWEWIGVVLQGFLSALKLHACLLKGRNIQAVFTTGEQLAVQNCSFTTK